MGPRKSQFILDSISDQNPMDMQFLRTFSLLSMGENDVSDEGIEVVWIKKLETESTASFKCCGAPRTASVSLAPRSGGRKPMLRRCQLCGLEGLPPSESSACQQSSASPFVQGCKWKISPTAYRAWRNKWIWRSRNSRPWKSSRRGPVLFRCDRCPLLFRTFTAALSHTRNDHRQKMSKRKKKSVERCTSEIPDSDSTRPISPPCELSSSPVALSHSPPPSSHSPSVVSTSIASIPSPSHPVTSSLSLYVPFLSDGILGSPAHYPFPQPSPVPLLPSSLKFPNQQSTTCRPKEFFEPDDTLLPSRQSPVLVDYFLQPHQTSSEYTLESNISSERFLSRETDSPPDLINLDVSTSWTPSTSTQTLLQLAPWSNGQNERVECSQEVHGGVEQEKTLPSGISLENNEGSRAVLQKKGTIRPFLCSECGKAFRYACDLRTHARTHTGERPFACNLCPKQFVQKSQLRKHLKLHEGKKDFVCSICSRAFFEKKDLINHSRIHSGEKPFRCEECGACFGRQHTLNMHKRKHTGEKPYKCDICNTSFLASSVLKNRMRLHSNSRFPCSLCNHETSKALQKANNANTHSDDSQFCCKMCSVSFLKRCDLEHHVPECTGI